MNLTEHVRAAGIVILTIVIVFIALLVTGSYLSDYAGGKEQLQLPLLVIAGLVALLGMLAVMAIAFKTVRLANQTQALGLPEGTVRAVIALSLILIFAVVTVYLFSDLSSPEPVPAGTVTSTTATDTTGTSGAAAAVTKAAAAQDFAKQLLIMLGTLITSITSYYFASKTGTETGTPRPAPEPKPQIDRVEPKTSPKGGPAKLIGTNLLTVDRVSLRQKAQEIAATNVSSSGTEVSFIVPPGAPSGPVDVVAKTHDGQEATLPGGMELA